MKLLYKGKTKDVYENQEGYVVLKFKDDVTGTDGFFDPGANTVGLTMAGSGKSGLRMTTHFFEILKRENIPTHFVASNLDDSTLTVEPANMFGKGLEIICRYKAVGSFLKRYGSYCEAGMPLDAFVEVTLKDDERQDPPISSDALAMLNILSYEEYDVLKKLTKQVSNIVKVELAQKDLELYDIKLEFGRHAITGDIMLIDEISGGNMRVYADGEAVQPLELESKLFF